MEIFNIENLKLSNLKYLYFLIIIIVISLITFYAIIRSLYIYNLNKKCEDKPVKKYIPPPPLEVPQSIPQSTDNYKLNNSPYDLVKNNLYNNNFYDKECTEKDNGKDEVFNISENIYTYNESKDVCKLFNADLASYDQIKKAYEKGAEWCNYGWSKGQNAYYPTQLKSWKKLQNNCKTKTICGKPGVNGGYFMNPELKFGVNCYGVKPKSNKCNTGKFIDNIHKTQEQIDRENFMKILEKNKSNIEILPFNRKEWTSQEVNSQNFINN